ncbi:MAG: response regulator [Polyangiaceae bacterium]|nr:response regulator [Polyangiaceae bacterium]
MTARVLLVDDDDASRLTLGALLEDEGMTVVEASSEEEAKSALADGPPFHLALLDLHLGDVLGTVLVADVAASSKSTRILVLSGDPPDREVAGIHGWIVKGDDYARTLAVISEQVSHATSAAE